MAAILKNALLNANESEEGSGSDEEYSAASEDESNDSALAPAMSVEIVPNPNENVTLAELQDMLQASQSANQSLRAQLDAAQVIQAVGAEKKQDGGDNEDEEQKPGVTANTGAQVKPDPDTPPRTKYDRWVKRVKTEILYAGEQDVLAWDSFDPRTANALPPVATYALAMDWTTPLSYWFVSRVLRTSRIKKLFIMPPDWKDYEDRVRVVMRLATAPHFQEGLRVAARNALPNGMKIEYITAPTRVSATFGNNIVNGAEDLNNDHLAATEIFLRAVRAGMDVCAYDAGMQQYTTSAAAREQFALLQVRKRNELASAKRQLSQYAYDPRTKQLVSKTKSAPAYYRSAAGLMSWPQYKRFRDSPSLQKAFLPDNRNNSARSR